MASAPTADGAALARFLDDALGDHDAVTVTPMTGGVVALHSGWRL